VLAFVLLDIGGLGFALAAPVWLAPWVTINLTALALGALSWSEDRRMQRESATAMQRQAEKVRAAKQRNLEERQREAQRQQQAEQAERNPVGSKKDVVGKSQSDDKALPGLVLSQFDSWTTNARSR
jgi:Flp pilus assembly protein TadB